ncbi:MAG: DNA-directed RNA polymerase subunit K [Fervidicoccaceae archaeon]|jgi:DNA-directed RNA polymerase subunit K/omega|nr:MAG: DNA-directed RNA polymerase subunit K [Fervidicoccus sp.]
MSFVIPKSIDEIIPPKRLTRFERARIISARALQLSLGAPPFIDLTGVPRDPIYIAERELEEGFLPITVARWLRGGVKQLIPVKWLIEEERRTRAGS